MGSYVGQYSQTQTKCDLHFQMSPLKVLSKRSLLVSGESTDLSIALVALLVVILAVTPGGALMGAVTSTLPSLNMLFSVEDSADFCIPLPADFSCFLFFLNVSFLCISRLNSDGDFLLYPFEKLGLPLSISFPLSTSGSGSVTHPSSFLLALGFRAPILGSRGFQL